MTTKTKQGKRVGTPRPLPPAAAPIETPTPPARRLSPAVGRVGIKSASVLRTSEKISQNVSCSKILSSISKGVKKNFKGGGGSKISGNGYRVVMRGSPSRFKRWGFPTIYTFPTHGGRF